MTTRLKSTCKAGILMAACVSLAVCASCSDEEVMKGYGESDKLSFGVSISEKWNTPAGTRSTAGEMPGWNASKFDNSDMWLIATSEECMDSTLFDKPERAQTRAAEVTSDSFYEDFGVYAYVYEGDGWANRVNVKSYFTAEKVTESSNDLWTTNPTRYWPGEQCRMHFFAYAPYSSQRVSINAANNIPVLSYTVPDKVTEQKDLVVATKDVEGNYNQSVPLQFKHILTAVKVKVAQGITGAVKKVALRNITKSGSYTFGGDSWTLDTNNEKNFEIVYDPPFELNAQNGTFIADGANTFMMIPQELGEKATLEVELDNGEKLTGSLYNKVDWEMGYTVIYNISRTKILYEFSATDPDTYAGEGGSKDVEIKSYKTTNGDQTPLEWTNGGYYSKNNDGTYTELAPSDWVVFPTSNQTEGTTEYSVKVYPQSGEGSDNTGENSKKEVTSPDKELQEMQEVGSESTPKNLAGTDGGETTANSYIVNGPGWYKFPIVYGNALKNGKDNEQAYNYATHIVNHLDKQITDPWIAENDITIGKAALLWQDSHFVDENSVQVEGDNNYIKFRIPAGQNCVQGNAVIAVKDDKGNIAWSWHIWVTLHKPDDTFKFGNFSFFHTLLGYREAELVKYPVREVYVKLVQEESRLEQYVHISQAHLYQFKQAGNAPYYQHGRKDPFPGASLEVTRDNNTGEYSRTVIQDKLVNFNSETVTESHTLDYAIQHPNTYIGQAKGNANWYWYGNMDLYTDNNDKTGYTDLWDNQNIKTVYDPCPAGYKIPSDAAIEFVSKTDKSDVEFVNTGMYFINNKNTVNEQRFFLQVLGARGYEGSYNGKMGSSLIASILSVQSNGSTVVQCLHFNPNQTDIYWKASGTACQGQCVLPQKE